MVCWLFVIILGLGYVASTKLGREFMPDLNEGSIMDMPTTVPRASIAEAVRDLRVRDEVLRGFPEVWQVVGKAGRAETPTDPSPLDMIETVVNLRDHEVWPKRKLQFDDAVAQTRVVLDALEAKGLLRRPASAGERDGLVNEAAMTVASTVDETLRDLRGPAAGGVPPGARPRPGRRGGRRPAPPRRTLGRRPHTDLRRA